MASVEKARMYGKAQITDRGTETQKEITVLYNRGIL
jgi:hypothetical protein